MSTNTGIGRILFLVTNFKANKPSLSLEKQQRKSLKKPQRNRTKRTKRNPKAYAVTTAYSTVKKDEEK